MKLEIVQLLITKNNLNMELNEKDDYETTYPLL